MGNRPVLATAAAALAVLLVSCASATQSLKPRDTTPAIPSHRTADDVERLARHVPCPPKANTVPATRVQLRNFAAVAAVTCVWDTHTYPRAGEWSVVIRKASDAGVDGLIAAFDQPNQPPSTDGCSLVLIGGPPLLLVDADGNYILARYPHDGCHNPQSSVIDVVRHHEWQTISVHRDKLIRSARSIATGCGDEAKDMLYYEPGSPLSPGEPVLNRHPNLTLHACIYHSSGSLDVGRFVRRVSFGAADSARLRDSLRGAGPTTECAPQRTFALIATPIWDKVGDADVAYVELGGCWRVYFDEWPAHDGQWRSLVGTADPAVITEMLRAK